MVKINPNYDRLPAGYLFPEIGRRIKAYQAAHPDKASKVIKLHIGNIKGANSIPPTVLEGLRRGVEVCASSDYPGYGDEEGEGKLREAIATNYRRGGVFLSPSEIFVSDGAKCDTANLASLFHPDSVIAVQDPVYPVYLDTNILTGKGGARDSTTGRFLGVVYMPCTEENSFFPFWPKEKVDLIYLCSPNNPTSSVLTREQLATHVNFALERDAAIVFDASYSDYIRDPNLPKTIYELPGAKKCAIEVQSFSKSAGFTGVRLGWSVVPQEFSVGRVEPGKLNSMWKRRQQTFFNGASIIAQYGGIAALSLDGQAEIREKLDCYLGRAGMLKAAVESIGLKAFGGINVPYVYVRTPKGMKSWDTLDFMLENAQISVAPGAGFGLAGEGYFRLAAFDTEERITEAAQRIAALKI